MASYNDLTVTDEDWVDLYTVLGVSTTNPLQIQNKGVIALYYQEATNKPLASSVHGIVISSLQRTNILPKAGEKAWVKAANGTDNLVESTTLAILLG